MIKVSMREALAEFNEALKGNTKVKKVDGNSVVKMWVGNGVMIWLFNKSLSYLSILSYLEGHILSGRSHHILEG